MAAIAEAIAIIDLMSFAFLPKLVRKDYLFFLPLIDYDKTRYRERYFENPFCRLKNFYVRPPVRTSSPPTSRNRRPLDVTASEPSC